VTRQSGEVVTLEFDRAGRRFDQPVDAADQRALARARRADC
jgi:hypothetical protein